MFDFDDSQEGGSTGPWISWKAKGTEDRSVNPKSFAIRGKDGEESYTRQFDGFARGVALDLESCQQGYIKDGTRNMPPERKWGVRDRPDDSKKPSGAYSWSKAFSIRVATSKTETATWEDASWGGYEGFRRLAGKIKAAGDKPGQSPVVRIVGTEDGESARGKFSVPIFDIVQWVSKPGVFTQAQTMAFDDTPEPAPQPVAKPAPAPMPADIEDFG